LSQRLTDLLNVRRRKAGVDALREKLGISALGTEIIEDAVHVWAVTRLRASERPFKSRTDTHFAKISDAMDWLQSEAGTSIFERCCVFHYGIDAFPAAVVNTNALFALLKKNPFLISDDGFVISNMHFSKWILFDFDGVNPDNDGVDVSVVGPA